MSLQIARAALLWCSLLNYGLLLVWALIFLFLRGWLYRLTVRWFRLSDEQFDALHYAGLMFYKVGIFLFNIFPLIALWIVG
jgi:hypothetical protein